MRDMRELLSHPYVLEVLDALSQRRMALADIRARSSRSADAAALRVLAAAGIVALGDSGTWDSIARATKFSELDVEAVLRRQLQVGSGGASG